MGSFFADSASSDAGMNGGLGTTRNSTTTLLNRVAQALRNKYINVHCVCLQENPDDAGKHILSYASRNDIDLITLATHGRGGLRRLFSGSVADFVLRNSRCPLLVIRPQKVK